MHIDERVIFVHNPRAAGTSVRRALCGTDPNEDLPWPASEPAGNANNQKHMLARQLKDKLPGDVWENRFKFAVVRNPYDRLVSLYYLFRRPMEPERQTKFEGTKQPYNLHKLMVSLHHPSIKDMRKRYKRVMAKQIWELGFKEWLLDFSIRYCWNAIDYIGEKPITTIQQSEWFDGLDRVYKFEELDVLSRDLQDMGYGSLPHENATVHRPWMDMYDAETRAFVREHFREDIERFGY